MIDYDRLWKATYIVLACAVATFTIVGGMFFLAFHAPWTLPFILFGLLVWMVYMTMGEGK